MMSYIIIAGASNCSWSSCREGCTRDIYECHQILVEYQPLQADVKIVNKQKEKKEAKKLRAALFVNIKGCGYPPTVKCDTWISKYGVNDSVVPCYYSKSNSSTAITHVDTATNMQELLLSVLIPIILLVVSGSGLYILHSDMCGFSRNALHRCCQARLTLKLKLSSAGFALFINQPIMCGCCTILEKYGN